MQSDRDQLDPSKVAVEFNVGRRTFWEAEHRQLAALKEDTNLQASTLAAMKNPQQAELMMTAMFSDCLAKEIEEQAQVYVREFCRKLATFLVQNYDDRSIGGFGDVATIKLVMAGPVRVLDPDPV